VNIATSQLLFIALVSVALCVPAGAAEDDLLSSLAPDNIESVRINLNPWGPHLGFETEIDGDDPRLEALVAVIKGGEPGCDHKCPNRGVVRFQMVGGRTVAVGLLPSHEEGDYGLRLYDRDRLQGVYCVQRETLLAAFERLDVPLENPTFDD
jgi:hypothetical protein